MRSLKVLACLTIVKTFCLIRSKGGLIDFALGMLLFFHLCLFLSFFSSTPSGWVPCNVMYIM